MHRKTRTATAVAGLLLVSLVAFGPAMAATQSDYDGPGTPAPNSDQFPNGTWNDWCTGLDADGIRPQPPAGEDFSCDGNSEDSQQEVTFNGGLLRSCVNAPDSTTVCQGGFIGFADTASAGGNFDFDYPKALSVAITSSVPMAFDWSQCERQWVNASLPAANPVVCTDYQPVCLDASNAFTLVVTPTHVNMTIDSVDGFRTLGSPLCGGSPGGQLPGTVTLDWTYDTEQIGNLANAQAAITQHFLDGCEVEWSYSASVPADRWGRATGQVYFDGQLGSFGLQSPEAWGASVTNGGTTFIAYGETIEVAATAWAINVTFARAYQPPVLCDPEDIPDPPQFEPICIAGALFANGAWTGQGVCLSPNGPLPALTCVNDDSSGDLEITCTPTAEACHLDVVAHAVALAAISGPSHTETTLLCNGASVAQADTDAGNDGVDIRKGNKTSGQWECTFRFSAGGADASAHAGACLDAIVWFDELEPICVGGGVFAGIWVDSAACVSFVGGLPVPVLCDAGTQSLNSGAVNTVVCAPDNEPCHADHVVTVGAATVGGAGSNTQTDVLCDGVSAATTDTSVFPVNLMGGVKPDAVQYECTFEFTAGAPGSSHAGLCLPF